MRLRFRDGRLLTTSIHHAENLLKRNGCSNPATWADYSNVSTGNWCGEFSSMWDMVTPGFHRRSKVKKEIFFNPAHRRSMKIDNGSGQYGGKYRNRSPDGCGFYPESQMDFKGSNTYGLTFSRYAFNVSTTGELLPQPLITSSADINSALIEAATECLDQRGRSKNNLWEFLAELEKSAVMCQELFEAMRKAIVFASKTKPFRDLATGAASAYLIYRYGLKPFIGDLASVADGMLSMSGKRRISSRGKVNISTNSVSDATGSAYAVWYYTGRHTVSETVEVRCTSLDEAYINLMEDIGLSIKGLITLPWELLTNSFVLDWFLNIGSLIGSFVPSPGLNQLGTCTVLKVRQTGNYSLINVVPYPAYDVVSYPSHFTCSYEYNSWERTLGLPKPGLVIKADFRFDVFTRVGDAIALAINQMARFPTVAFSSTNRRKSTI